MLSGINPTAKCFLLCVPVGVIALTAAGCRGPSPDWNGTWKLDPAKSDNPGTTFTVSMSPDGVYRSGSGASAANFRCDGKGYKSLEIFTFFCTQESKSDLEITEFKNGSKARAVHWQLSPDGKMLTVHSTSLQADGSAKSKENRYSRTSGSTGFAGGWRNVNPFEPIASIWQISMDSREMRYSYPEKNEHVEAFIDGTDADIHGPDVLPGASIALLERNPRELGTTFKMNGRVLSVGYFRISADGRTLTDSYWQPNRPGEKAVLVYDKQ
jgi:hypothetical protein